ncbi:MAG: hypothetical protein K9N47_23235 [Prosthecobacter sp.]|uniref:hypothetical protein n=1 Tax=Prosthecobacter sp. TaxID=1965333 RepID=UPI0026061C36|nr:hypothetical protein [Prosthecobacter sp.]MCF7789057.1 hypothetical protein [Prosthecobacter sp.]
MTLNFEPYIGAPPLRFGITTKEASAILGEPGSVQINTAGPAGREFTFDEMRLAFDTNDHLYQIGFDKNFTGTLLYNGTDILRHSEALKLLSEIDGKPCVWVGFIMLMNLGLRLGGYHEEADEGRTVSIFNRGRYDSKISRLTPFVM